MKTLYGLLILCCALFVGWSVKGCRSKPPIPIVQNVGQDDTIQHYKDAYGTEHTTRLMEVNNYAALYAEHTHMLDSLKKRLHLRDKQLQDMSQVLSQATGHVETVLDPYYIHDTINGEVSTREAQLFNWHDAYTSISGVIDRDNVSIDYDVQMPVTTTKYWRRKHTFCGIGWGKKIYYIDAFSDNPNVHISGLTGFKVN